MMLARQSAVRLADLVRSGVALHPEGFVIVRSAAYAAGRPRPDGPAPSLACLLLVVDVDELGVDDVVLRLLPRLGAVGSGPVAARRRPGAGRGAGLALYIASASLWLAWVSLSMALLISSTLPLGDRLARVLERRLPRSWRPRR